MRQHMDSGLKCWRNYCGLTHNFCFCAWTCAQENNQNWLNRARYIFCCVMNNVKRLSEESTSSCTKLARLCLPFRTFFDPISVGLHQKIASKTGACSVTFSLQFATVRWGKRWRFCRQTARELVWFARTTCSKQIKIAIIVSRTFRKVKVWPDEVVYGIIFSGWN